MKLQMVLPAHLLLGDLVELPNCDGLGRVQRVRALRDSLYSAEISVVDDRGRRASYRASHGEKVKRFKDG